MGLDEWVVSQDMINTKAACQMGKGINFTKNGCPTYSNLS